MKYGLFAKIGAAAMVAAALGLTAASPASAQQVVGIGTTQGGANASVGAAIAKVVSDSAGFQMRPEKMGGTQQYVPIVNAGELEFGLSNVMEYEMSLRGTGLSEGQPSPNLRLVATLMEFRNGVIVAKNSGINTLADLKGKRLPDGYGGAPLFLVFRDAFLASAGLSSADVQLVPVAGLPQSWDAFKKGDVDMTIAAAGAGAVTAMDAAVDGGIKFIPVLDNAVAQKALPNTRFSTIEPAAGLVGVIEPTTFNVYEYVLFTNDKVSDDVVYKVVKALHEGTEGLKATGPLWNTYFPQNIGTAYKGLAYHPGAMKYFKEKGLN